MRMSKYLRQQKEVEGFSFLAEQLTDGAGSGLIAAADPVT